jgi:predicted nuclease with TOPRIM domain
VVHDAINDVLSELRGNILLIQGEFAELSKEDSSESVRIIREAIAAIVGNAEDAKGALRSLRELVDLDS